MPKILERYRGAIGFGLLLAGFCTLSVWRGPDANWDLRNYHLYNPFALLNGKFGYDLVPAQIQTFNAPQLDLLYYWLRLHLNAWPVLLACILSLPHVAGAMLALCIALHCIAADIPGRAVLAFMAAVIGATGASALPTLGASDSDMVSGSLCLAGLLFLLTACTRPSRLRYYGFAGLAFGAAFGLKLTAAPFCAGAIAALLAGPGAQIKKRILAVAVFGMAGVAAACLLGGPWWVVLTHRFGSPVFPYFNDVFQSPFYAPVRLADDRFKPHGFLQVVFYPFFWAVRATPGIAELPLCDPRMAIAYLALVAIAVQAVRAGGWPDAKTRVLSVFFSTAYVMWEAQFSIQRYLAPLEFLSAMPVLVAARRWRWLPWGAMAVMAAFAWGLTVYPEWGHARRHGPAVRVQMPALPDDALVVMMDDAPMAYVAAFASPHVRFVGANNNLIRPGQDTVLARQIEATIRDARGPIWGLDDPTEFPGQDAAVLRYYKLKRVDGCAKIVSNLDGGVLRLCPLASEAAQKK
jgi:hypothetical protein